MDGIIMLLIFIVVLIFLYYFSDLIDTRDNLEELRSQTKKCKVERTLEDVTDEYK